MDDVCDLHIVFADSINHHEGKRRQRKFSGPFHTARPTLVRKRLQRISTVVDGPRNALSRGCIVFPDVFDNSEKVFRGGRGLAQLHLLTKHLLDASADFFVRWELASIELLQALGHLLAEPCVMVDVVFHKLLDVFLCAALVFGRRALHFRLQLGRKMHFHIFSA